MNPSGVTAGVYCPLVTPFDHREDLYFPKLRHNISRLNEVALAGYLVASRIGEGDMLTLDERLRLWEAAAETAREARQPKTLIAVTVQPGVRACLLDLEKAAALGYTAAVVESQDPFLIRCVADRSPLPVLDPAPSAPPGANAIPYAYVTIFEAERSRETEAAADWRHRLEPVEALLVEFGVAGVKAAMDRYGFYGGAPRLPRVRLAPGASDQLMAALSDIRS